MSQDIPTRLTLEENVDAQVRASTPDLIVSIIVDQLVRMNEAKRRINEEGIVVRDMKGSVIPHPAIKIEIDAGKIASDMISKYK